jgi:hypothetical protein
MLFPPERQLLVALGRAWNKRGQIVDAGCFLGGSTFALASGLEDGRRWWQRRSPVIRTYDLFRLTDEARASYPDLVAGLEVGASIRPQFDRLLGRLGAYAEVYEGDIRNFQWDGQPIEILFLDVCKTWGINDHVSREFFPALIPGDSVLVHEDFVHEWLPHIPITMGLLADAFELVEVVPPASAVFVPTRRIARDEVPPSLQCDLSSSEKLDCFDRACAPFEGVEKSILECARANLLQELGEHSDALRVLDRIRTEGSDRVAGAVAETRSWLLRSNPDPAISGPAWERWHSDNR